jgi:serine/threonine protein kinase
MMNRSTSFFFGYQNQISGTESEFSRDSLNDKDIGGPGGSYDDRISIESLKTVDDLIVSLDVLNIQGPLTLHAPFLKSLGKGAQFSVTQGSLLESGMTSGGSAINLDEEVAVKCPLFAATDRRLDLTSRSSRRQIHDIYLEIAILRNSTLQGHRNIVRLIGWGLDHRHKMPLLVLELAIGDLSSVLASPKSLISESVAQQLSLDIGHGLDAIHDLGIVHGDLKPPNILLFQSPHLVPFVAKLADFGLSLSELHSEEDSLVAVAGMSVDWCAPEIKSMAKLTASHFVKADNFSYGLVLLSLNCLNGRPPKSKNLDTAIDIVGSHRTLSSSFRDHLAKALSLLLHEDPTKRLMCVKNVMKNSSEACTTWLVTKPAYQSDLIYSGRKMRLIASHQYREKPLGHTSTLGIYLHWTLTIFWASKNLLNDMQQF